MKKFRIRVVSRVYAIFEASAETQEEAVAALRAGEARYIERDHSDDHTTETHGEVYSIEEVL